MRRFLVAGNWKMNTTKESGAQLAKALVGEVPNENQAVEVLVCPPFPYLSTIGDIVNGSGVGFGAQNCYHEAPGAFTGETATEMLTDIGCRSVILGHSERRHILKETDADINLKVKKALDAGLQVILCVGELQSERESEQTEAVLNTQMTGGLEGVDAAAFSQIVIAYEPVWAIGTGLTASPEQAESAHQYLRNWLKEHYSAEIADSTRILYGGSVKPDNAKELLSQENVDGALVGGASLKAELFIPIIQAAVELSAD
ncbi:triose-phosphate isomerase [Gimesia fumaroli]|uniref:Triosephosphate isomerase n=1 Tax=Gimesia fumaroli TaxID=2527976 RepID=A0A518IAN9_9PLAN|nr:triose-phosphate isomerase [Gimesia fumaroli]QDV50164.1 Triosephosphate isomerase [Gimesia fumaroli]